MRVLLLTYDDFANVAFEFTEALKSVGVDAFGMKYRQHPFNYYEELPIRESPMELAGLIRGFDHIIYLQSILLDSSAIPRDCKYMKIFLYTSSQTSLCLALLTSGYLHSQTLAIKLGSLILMLPRSQQTMTQIKLANTQEYTCLYSLLL